MLRIPAALARSPSSRSCRPSSQPRACQASEASVPLFEAVEVVSNPLAVPSEVWFEPWGMPHTLAPGQSFRIVAVSEQPGELEIVRDETRVAVYAWPGSTMRVYCGERLVEDLWIKCPGLPSGTSTKSFVEFFFEGPGGTGFEDESEARERDLGG